MVAAGLLVPGEFDAGGSVPGLVSVWLSGGIVVPGSVVPGVEVLGDALGGTGFVVLGVPDCGKVSGVLVLGAGVAEGDVLGDVLLGVLLCGLVESGEVVLGIVLLGLVVSGAVL